MELWSSGLSHHAPGHLGFRLGFISVKGKVALPDTPCLGDNLKMFGNGTWAGAGRRGGVKAGVKSPDVHVK